MGSHKGTVRTEYDDISMKAKLIFHSVVTLRFIEKSFFITLLAFTPLWEYYITKTIHVDSAGVYTSEKNSNLSTKNKIHLKCDVIDGSIVDCLRQPILISFTLDKPYG